MTAEIGAGKETAKEKREEQVGQLVSEAVEAGAAGEMAKAEFGAVEDMAKGAKVEQLASGVTEAGVAETHLRTGVAGTEMAVSPWVAAG